jgi:hypothetical protein
LQKKRKPDVRAIQPFAAVLAQLQRRLATIVARMPRDMSDLDAVGIVFLDEGKRPE